jgi:hypothetical protein
LPDRSLISDSSGNLYGTTSGGGSFPYEGTVFRLDDGHLDLAVTNLADNTVSVLLGNGNGTFSAGSRPTVGAEPVIVSSSGSMPLTIAGVTAKGNYSQTSNCVATFLPGESCTASVTFTPQAKGNLFGTLKTFDNAPVASQSVNLRGSDN